jgi:hypothetical protein
MWAASGSRQVSSYAGEGGTGGIRRPKETVGLGGILYRLIQHARFGYHDAITRIHPYNPEHSLQRECNSSFLREAAPCSSRTSPPRGEGDLIVITKVNYRTYLVRVDRKNHGIGRKKLTTVVITIHEAIDRVRIEPVSWQ